jgi:polysaccharide chain length determinant protein (PEP-CTERM system associated)
MLPREFDFAYYSRALLRRRWLVIVPFFLVVIAGIIYALTAPKTYEASTLILVQRQKVPENYIKSTVSDTLTDRISTIREQVTSRTNLESLITEFGLYESKDPEKSDMTTQDKVELMRKHIEILVSRGAAFSVAFRNEDPQKTMKVANALAQNFIDENLRVREDLSVGTTNFLQRELERIEAMLKEKEAILTEYKQRHMGSLPDQLATNLQLLGELREKIVSIERSLDEARSQKVMFQGQMANMDSVTNSGPTDQLTMLDPGGGMSATPELQELKDSLKALRLRYTANHPDVVKLQKMIARIEQEQAEEPAAGTDQAPLGKVIAPGGGDLFTAQAEVLQVQMASFDQTIRDLLAQKAKLEQESSRLAQIISDTPKRQMEINALERDYDTIKKQYDSLLAKQLESQLAANMEMRQKGEQFQVIDHAKLPEKPVSPNIPRIIFLAVAVGLAAGFGLALGTEHLDPSFRDAKEVGEFLQLPVLAVIPRMRTAADIRKRRRFRVFACCLSGCLLLAVGFGIWFWVNGDLQEWVQKIGSLV